jgi:hypothetical protein
MGNLEALYELGGAIVAVLGLLGASVWLLSIEGTDAKVLVAVWLWAWPAITLGALGGWLAGRARKAMTR